MDDLEGRASHPIFRRFSPAEVQDDGRFLADFLGVRARRAFHANYRDDNGAGYLRPDLQSVTSEYFEWISVLCAVAAATTDFTMIEAGSGWGRWLLRGAMACRQVGRGFRLVGVEAEPEHFEWMKAAFRDNGLEPDEHLLVNAAVAGRGGEGWFVTGDPRGWYGQSLVPEGDAPWYAQQPQMNVSRVRQVGLVELLQRFEKVHLVDMDVQGAEAEIVEAAADSLDRVVEMAHVSTHSHEVEERLRAGFTRMGWLPIFDFPCLGARHTPYGEVGFVDGVQTWIHPSAGHLLGWLADGAILRQAIREASARKVDDERQVTALKERLTVVEQQLLDETALRALRREMEDFRPAVVRVLRWIDHALRRLPILGPFLRRLVARAAPPAR
jgi:FkbM family methyltransferase